MRVALPPVTAPRRPCSATLAAACAGVLIGLLGCTRTARAQNAVNHAKPPAPVELSDRGYLRVGRQPIEVTIPRQRVTLDRVVKLPLITEDDTSYFVALENTNVCAFPKTNNRLEPVARIGEGNMVFFFQKVSSQKAHLSIPAGTELAVIDIEAGGYRARIGGLGGVGTVFVPKDETGVSLHDESLLEEYERISGARARQREAQRKAAATREAEAARKTAHKTHTRVPTPGVAETPGRATEPGARLASVKPREKTPAPDRPRRRILATVPRGPPPDFLTPFAGRFALSALSAMWSRLCSRIHWMTMAVADPRLVACFAVLLGTCVVGLLFLRLRRAGYLRFRGLHGMPKLGGKARRELEQQSEGREISGSLELVSIVDLVQFLNTTHQNGTLLVGDRADPAAKAVFVGGQIKSAKCGLFDGEDALFAMLREKGGPFVFFKGTIMSEGREITSKTTSLLMEGVRRLDENSRVDDSSAPKLKARLREMLRKKG